MCLYNIHIFSLYEVSKRYINIKVKSFIVYRVFIMCVYSIKCKERFIDDCIYSPAKGNIESRKTIRKHISVVTITLA